MSKGNRLPQLPGRSRGWGWKLNSETVAWLPKQNRENKMAENTFKQAYGVLQKHAEVLRSQQEPNIDDLLTIVTESVDAYKVCKERIDAVEKALEHALSGAGVSNVELRCQSWRAATGCGSASTPRI